MTSHLFNNSVYLECLETPATPSIITLVTQPAALYLPPTHRNIAISNIIKLLTGVLLRNHGMDTQDLEFKFVAKRVEKVM